MEVKMESYRNDTTAIADVATGHTQENISNEDHTTMEYSQSFTGLFAILYFFSVNSLFVWVSNLVNCNAEIQLGA